MKVAISDSKKVKLISEFTHTSDFQLTNRNITSQSNAASLYNEFKNTIKFEEEHLQYIYGSKYAQHFFTKLYRENAIKRWKK